MDGSNHICFWGEQVGWFNSNREPSRNNNTNLKYRAKARIKVALFGMFTMQADAPMK